MGVGALANVCEGQNSCGPKCLRWKLLMESGPVAGEFLMLLLMCLVFCGEKGVRFGLLDRKPYVLLCICLIVGVSCD